MDKNLEYYMKLPYTLVVRRDEDNSGQPIYIARVLEIPHVLGDGTSAQDALECLNLHLRMAIESYLKDGLPIPEPQNKYSGNLNIRIDPLLHRRLAEEAATYETSLNKYTSLILERRQEYRVKPPAKVNDPSKE